MACLSREKEKTSVIHEVKKKYWEPRWHVEAGGGGFLGARMACLDRENITGPPSPGGGVTIQ